MRDLRLALRHLTQSPGYTITAVLTLALAIGANSAIFSAVNAVLLRPIPVEDPSRIAIVWQTRGASGAVIELTYRHLREWSAAGRTFTSASMIASHNWNSVLTGHGEPTRVWFNGVSGNFFETLGARPLLGRTFRGEDDLPHAAPVAVLNYSMWTRRFASDPAIVGKTMMLDGRAVEIVGVMPAGLDIPRGAEFWMPSAPILVGTDTDTSALDGVGVSYVIGRVQPGLAVDAVRPEIDTIEARLDRADPARMKWGERAVVTPLLDYVFGPMRLALRLLWAAVAVLLLIACANVSGLMLTRVARRRQEHAIRLALGAGRRAIAQLWLTEILVTSIAGGLLGLLCAAGLARAIIALAPDDLPRLNDIGIDMTVAIFTFAAVLLVAIVTGLMPLRQAGAARLIEAMDGVRTTASRQALRARSALLIFQVALSVVLLIAAGLVVRSFGALRSVDLGFSPDRVLSLTIQPGTAAAAPNQWFDRLLARVREVPGVEAAGAVYLRPLMLGPIGDGVHAFLEGQPINRETAQRNPILNHQIATPGYFEALRIPLRAGRLFTPQDTTDKTRVVIVGESTARRLWPGQDPIGKRLTMATYRPGQPAYAQRTVVGVVSDVRYHALGEVQLDIYDPALQVALPANNILVRASGDPRALTSRIHALARELDGTSVIDDVTTMEAVVARAQAPWRLTMWMFVIFAALAFGLAALGLFSLVALDVTQRRKEFAIRLALGSPRTAILRSVLARSGWRVGSGVAIGLFVAVAASQAMRSLLFGIAPGDVITYAGVMALVIVVVAIAAYMPARRALDDDPQVILRQA
jgi:putative ABC transport system permease protein